MDLNSQWIRQSLEYHGLPLKSIWDGERGEEELTNLGLTKIDYTTYRQRTKNFGPLEERRFRVKLQKFIVKNAATLFDSKQVDSVVSSTTTNGEEDPSAVDLKKLPVIAKAPPFEYFLGSNPLCERRVHQVK